jgi:hypothetical protein
MYPFGCRHIVLDLKLDCWWVFPISTVYKKKCVVFLLLRNNVGSAKHIHYKAWPTIILFSYLGIARKQTIGLLPWDTTVQCTQWVHFLKFDRKLNFLLKLSSFLFGSLVLRNLKGLMWVLCKESKCWAKNVKCPLYI